jgi:hypothetical protein
MTEGGHHATRALFEQNLQGKREDPNFRSDMSALLRPGVAWDFDAALDRVLQGLIALLPGDPWKGED